jgi:hypothetical protein
MWESLSRLRISNYHCLIPVHDRPRICSITSHAGRMPPEYEGGQMFGPYWQYQIPLWVVFLLFLVLLIIPMEVGFRLGSRQRRLRPDAKGAASSDVTMAAMLALLGLMLAFTYSFVMSRADLRKQALITEVNAISTAFVRADLLPEPGRSEVRKQLYDYARSRQVAPGSIETLKELQETVDRSLEVQSRLWPAVKSALRQKGNMTDPEKALLVAAINDVLDSHTRRMAVFYDRLPTAVLGLLVLIAGVSLGLAAYNSSISGQPSRWRMSAFALILASLMYIILDYDMMMRGLIQVDHRSLDLLIQDLGAALTQ